MSRYIDADIFYTKIEQKYKYTKGEARQAYRYVLNDICDTPTADVEEVRHGEWEEVTTNAIDDLAFDTVASMRCSKCDRYHNRVYHYGDPTEMEHYCSFCGAKMDGGTK